MNISFNILHKGITKKVTINKNKTIGDLISIAAPKFNITNGELYYQSKKLSALDPIKYTNVINNCKLELKAGKVAEVDVNIKFILPNGQTTINKYSNRMTLTEIINTLNISESDLTLSILNKTIRLQDCSVALHQIIGDVTNVVIRINVAKEETQEQRDIVKEELRLSELKKKKAMELRVLEDQQRDQRLREYKKVSRGVEDGEGVVVDTEDTVSGTGEETEEGVGLDTVSGTGIKTEGSEMKSENDTPSESTPKTHSNSQKPIEPDLKDTIYKPSNVTLYENPDSDYDFTVNHAKIYQETIKFKPKLHNKVSKIPSQYLIRIKFPNNYLLQFKLEKMAKFGELVKKIDDHLLPNAQSNYNLKLSYPPFTKFPISFELNSKTLVDLKIGEKEILIWESSESDYLIEDNVKSFDSLPEIQLEHMRHELADEPETEIIENDAKPSPKPATRKASNSGTPKWFKLGK